MLQLQNLSREMVMENRKTIMRKKIEESVGTLTSDWIHQRNHQSQMLSLLIH